MKHNKPPSTLKSTCVVESSLQTIRKSLLLLSDNNNNNLECEENLSLKIRNEIISCQKESVKIINKTKPLHLKLGNNKMYSTDVLLDKLKANISSKNFFQGEAQKDFLASINQTSTEQYTFYSASSAVLLHENNNNKKQFNMITRNRKRKLYNLNDFECSQAFQKSDMNKEDSDSLSANNNVIVTKALIEPLPEHKGKCSKPIKKIKHTRKAVTEKITNFDAIEIINSSQNNEQLLGINKTKMKEINLPRTLTKLNENKNYGNVDKNNLVVVEKKQEGGEVNNNKENYNVNVVNNNNNNDTKTPPCKDIKKKRGRQKIIKPKPITKRKNINRRWKDSNSDSSDTNEIKATSRKCREDDINSIMDSISNNIPRCSPIIAGPRKQKNKYSKTVAKSKNYYYDPVMRRDANYDGYESLHSDNELFTVLKKSKSAVSAVKKNKDATEPELKYVIKPLSFKPKFKQERKSESSSTTSPLLDLDIELQTQPWPVERERLTDSNDENDKNMLPNNKIQVVNTHDSAVQVPETVLKQTFSIMDVENFEEIVNTTNNTVEIPATVECNEFKEPVMINLASDSTIPLLVEVPAVENENMSQLSYNLSPEINKGYSEEAVRNWIATGQQSDTTEIFKNMVEILIFNYRNLIKSLLEEFKQPVPPSLSNLHNLLTEQYGNINKYFEDK